MRRDPQAVVLVRVRSPKGELRWVLPKGLIEPGEAAEQAARREVREETGFETDVAGPAGEVEYWFVMDGARHHKRVRFFLMWITGGRAEDHDAEVEEVALFPPEQVLSIMAYADERRVVADVLAAAGGRGPEPS